MIIEDKDYRLVQINDSSPFFDLDLLRTINPKGKESREEFQTVAYGITLEDALKKIVNFRINKDNCEILTLKEYLEEYKKQVNSLRDLCNAV